MTKMNGEQLTPGMDEITVIFAHPDDELLYFYQLLQQLKPKRLQLVCVTGRFGRDQTRRLAELAAAATELGGELTNLELEDCRGEALDEVALQRAIALLTTRPDIPVLTHGPFGEYGHRHHVDVFRAVLQNFAGRVWCLSGPLIADYQCSLDEQSYRRKLALVSAIYPSQKINGFATSRECLTHVQHNEFGAVLLASCGKDTAIDADVAAAFIERAYQVYFNPQSSIPVEAQANAKLHGKAEIKRRMRPLLRQWQQWLMLKVSY